MQNPQCLLCLVFQFLLCIINQAQLLALPRPFPSLLVQTHFIFSHKMICTKFPRPSCYFSVYEFNEYDRGNYEICFYIRAGIFGTSLKQLYFAAIPYLPTRDERGSPQWRQDAQVYRVPKVIGQAGNLKRHMVIHSKERHRLCPVQQVFWPS